MRFTPSAPSPEPDNLPVSGAEPPVDTAQSGGRTDIAASLPHGDPDGGNDFQQMFTAALLAIVGAYGMTRSVVVTVIAGIMALLVALVTARKK